MLPKILFPVYILLPLVSGFYMSCYGQDLSDYKELEVDAFNCIESETELNFMGEGSGSINTTLTILETDEVQKELPFYYVQDSLNYSKLVVTYRMADSLSTVTQMFLEWNDKSELTNVYMTMFQLRYLHLINQLRTGKLIIDIETTLKSIESVTNLRFLCKNKIVNYYFDFEKLSDSSQKIVHYSLYFTPNFDVRNEQLLHRYEQIEKHEIDPESIRPVIVIQGVDGSEGYVDARRPGCNCLMEGVKMREISVDFKSNRVYEDVVTTEWSVVFFD